MSLPQASEDFYRNQQRVTAVVVGSVRRQWSQMGDDFDGSWRRVGPRIVSLLMAGQTASARQVEQYMTEVLEETGQPDRPVARPNPSRLTGVGSDGRPLADVVRGAVVASKKAMPTTGSSSEALAAGGRWLDMAVQTTIADTSRSTTAVAIAVRPDVGGYVRMVSTPACSRCILLAGRFYRWNEGFQRHPRCDCRHIPSRENVAGDMTTDPNAYFKSIDTAEQDRIFGAAGAQALREGADMGRVVNVRKGTYTTADSQRATRTGTSRRSNRTVRLMPETIFKQAATREDALGLLRQHGFLL